MKIKKSLTNKITNYMNPQNPNNLTRDQAIQVNCNSSDEVMQQAFEKIAEGYDVKIYNQPRKGIFAFLFNKKRK